MHSTVRHAIDMPFPGRAVVQSVMLADVRLRQAPPDALTLNTSGDAFALIAPFGDGWFRIIAWDRRNQPPEDVPVSLEEVADVARRALGTDYGLHDPRWMSRFHSEERRRPAPDRRPPARSAAPLRGPPQRPLPARRRPRHAPSRRRCWICRPRGHRRGSPPDRHRRPHPPRRLHRLGPRPRSRRRSHRATPRRPDPLVRNRAARDGPPTWVKGGAVGSAWYDYRVWTHRSRRLIV